MKTDNFILNEIAFNSNKPHLLHRHAVGLIADQKFTGIVHFWSETFAGNPFMDTVYMIDGVTLNNLDFIDGDDERQRLVNHALHGLIGQDVAAIQSDLKLGEIFEYVWDDDGDDMGTYAVRRQFSHDEIINNLHRKITKPVNKIGEIYTGGCVKIVVDGSDFIESVEDPMDAEFFTVYVRNIDGFSSSLYDFERGEQPCC
ncbi:hypothetical protein THIAE_06050 [Thiomicrospira aerophila AL3]|uniref:Uncharacterized protein n=1 Tax=Thiomicrospira aerophila AL3 TaxID=717772 RepID=W0DUM5_9GAMM|nr:hypothetical protein [Thiomicrospira aerophila]AHF02285.1 hypothetical protein THIAE_06050 [Thiomicrospira aerophila AL3]